MKLIAIALITLSLTGMSSDTFHIKGSSTLFPVVSKAGEIFARKYNTQVIVSKGGSSTGVKFALEEDGMGMASRALKLGEMEEGAVPVVVGKDGLVIIVHEDNKMKNFTNAQVRSIFSGTVSNWKEIGGHDGKIQIIGQGKKHGTHGAFIKFFKLGDAFLYDGFESYDNQRDILFKVSKNKNAIGWVPIGLYNRLVIEGKRFKVFAPKYEFVEPTFENVKTGTYKITRPLILVTRGAAKGNHQKFADFMRSSTAQNLVYKSGFIPIK